MRRHGALLTFLLLAVVGVLGMTAAAGAAPASSAASQASPLLQFTAGDHVLGFERGGLYVASADHLVRIDFAGGRAVAPEAARGTAGDSAAATSPGDVTPLERVAYRDVWPGVTVAYTGAGSGAILKSSYRVAAGDPAASAARITLQYNRGVRIEASGELVVAYEGGELRESAPVAWQTIGRVRVPVQVRFRLLGERRVGFAVGACDSRYTLVIDPSLTWVAFFGGGSDDYSRFIARDGDGNLYVVGDSTASWQGVAAPVNAYADKQAAYVAKLSSSGALLWNTFLGGDGDDTGNGIALGGDGSIYATGTSDATWGSGTVGSVTSPVRAYSGGTDAWVAKLDGSSGARTWNTFLGSPDRDQGFSVAVGGADVYVGGWSNATWQGASAPLRAHEGDNDFCAFVARLDTDGDLTWNLFLGGNGTSENPDALPSTWLAADGGNVYVSAVCAEAWAVTTPSPLAAVRPYTSGFDGCAAKLTSAGVFVWYTFLGGDGDDLAFGITAPDGSGNVYVSGSSTAAWQGATAPVNPHSLPAGNYEGFAVKLDGGGVIGWNTFFGSTGKPNDGNAVAVDATGGVYVAGTSWANWGSPIRAFSGVSDGFLVKFGSSGARLWNTFLGAGGTGVNSQIWGVVVDGSGSAYTAGYSNAAWPAYPEPSPLRAYTLGYDGFVAKVDTNGALVWNTFQGGGSDCFARWLTRDSSNNLFVVGDCTATWGTPQRAFQGTRDCFVAKMTGAGVPSWNTFLGGAGTDYGYGIVLDAAGSIYVTGTSTGTWPSSPEATPLHAYAGGIDVFVAKLTGAGALSWNTFMGSSANDESFSLAISGSDLFVGGWSNATWGSPVRSYVSGYDAFVAKVTTAGAVTWNTFLGGYGATLTPPNGIPNTWLVADASGNVYVSAVCNAVWTDAGSSAVRPYSAGYDAYAAKLTSAGAVAWYTFLGAAGTDIAYGITADSSGNSYLSGSSTATWQGGSAPVNPHSSGSNLDAFAVKLGGSGAIIWNTFFGSATEENDGNAVAVDASGNVYVAGTSFGAWGTPWRAYAGGEAGFIAKFDSTGGYLWNGFLGGAGKDDAWGLVLDGSATAYVVGGSDRTWGSSQVTSGFKEGTDGFVAAVSLPGAVWTGDGADANQSTHANWEGSARPASTAPDNAIAFPVGAARKVNVNDLLTTNVGQVGFAEGGYTITGNALTLGDNTTAMTSSGDNIWAIDSLLPSTNTRRITTLSGTLTMSGLISGTGTLSKNGTGSLTLNPANVYTGATRIDNGTLNAGDVDSADGASSIGNPLPANAVVQIGAVEAVTDAYLNYTGGVDSTFTRGMATLRGGGITVATSGVTLTVGTGGLTVTGVNLTLGGAGNVLVTSVIGGVNGNVVKSGPGTLTLAGPNTYTGFTRISAGTVVADKLDFAYPGSLGQPVTLSTKTIFLGDTGTKGTLQYTGPSVSTARSIVLGAGGGEIDTSNTLTLPGTISGAGGLTLSGGVFEIGGTNIYNGDTTIASGTVRQFFNNNRFPSGVGKGNVTVAAYATLDTHGYGLRTNGLSGGGTITNTATAPGGGVYVYVGHNDAWSTFSGILSETNGTDAPLRLTKVGSGTLTLSGASTYTGYTAVTGGVLLVNGSVESGLHTSGTVDAAGTLGGDGAVNSPLTVAGVLAPGATVGSIGTLQTGRETWSGGGRYTVDINDTAGPSGGGYDLLEIAGDLTIDATSGSRFTVKLEGTALHWALGGNYRWPVAHYSGNCSTFVAEKFTLDTSDFKNAPNSTGFSLVRNETDNTIDIVYAGPTAVTVASFGAKLRRGHVVASWTTASLGDTVGFFLYRRSLRTGKWYLVTRTLVPAQFGKPAGATYRVLDGRAPSGRRLTYRLKELSSGGGFTWHGPYRVRPKR